jgi:hypothetical protein
MNNFTHKVAKKSAKRAAKKATMPAKRANTVKRAKPVKKAQKVKPNNSAQLVTPQIKEASLENSAPELTENNVLFLIGAGCSATAGIKMANQMVEDIEKFVIEKKDWIPYSKLYYYLKSAILYSDGIGGNFTTSLNVERLVVVLSELGKKEQNIAYPFIGNWNTRLMEVAGKGFEDIEAFQDLIKKQLFDWINIGNFSEAEYYSGFSRFKTEFGYPIRIFSFNYDLCIEMVIKDLNIELGFDPKTKGWLYSNFEPNRNKDIDIYLYKLHGSIDWERATDKGNVLVKRTGPGSGSELIFGTDAKLTSTDPYLYYVFEFRKYSLSEDCKLIIVIGYSFSDDYMNKLIAQSLSASQQRNILIVDLSPERLKEIFVSKYGVNESQVKTWKESADVFLKDKLSLNFLAEYLPSSDESPFSL